MNREEAMLKVIQDIVDHGKDVIPGWRLLENAQKALLQGGPQALKKYYERCLHSKNPKSQYVAATVKKHGTKTLESEYPRFLAAYHIDSPEGNLVSPPNPLSGSFSNAQLQPEVSADELARNKRCLDRLLDQIENRPSQDDTLVPRIRR